MFGNNLTFLLHLETILKFINFFFAFNLKVNRTSSIPVLLCLLLLFIFLFIFKEENNCT